MSIQALGVPSNLTPARALPERLSMSFLRRAEQCLRAAQLDREADTAEEPATVGRIVHQAAATAALYAQSLGVEKLPSATIEAIFRKCLRNPDETVDALSLVGWRQVMRLARVFSDTHHFPPGAQYEVASRRELDGFVFSARIDKRWFYGTTCEIEDIKTGGQLPKHGSPLPFQLENYAWQTLAEFPWVEDFVLTLDCLPYGIRRTWRLSTRDLIDGTEDVDPIEDYLSDQAARLSKAYAEQGPLKARRGSWCSTCPDPDGCPLPESAHDESTIQTASQAANQLDALLLELARSDRRKKRLRAFVDESDAITYVVRGDMEIGYKADSAGDSARFAIRKARTEDR